jgi:putative transposase
MKLVEETGWLKEVNSQSLQYSLKCLDGAFQRFFKKTSGFPKFHNRFRTNSFTIPANTRIKRNTLSSNLRNEFKLVIPKFLEGISIIMHRPIEGEICTSTISKEPTGEYYVAITVERDMTPVISKFYQPTGSVVGIDLGIKDLIISSNPKTKNEPNPKNTYKYQDKLKKLQAHLSKKVKGSSNRNKARLKVAKIHKKITNSRKDAIQKATTNLVRNNDIIIMENLKTRNMLRNRKLAKAISDASFGEIKRQLEYKCTWYNKVLVKIGTFYPSSKTCSACGCINQSLTLKDRRWSCTQCAINHDRDINASKNILKEGLRCISSGTGDLGSLPAVRTDGKGAHYTHGANVSLNVIKQLALKWEASTALA